MFPLHRILVFYGLFGSHTLRTYLLLASIDGMQMPSHSWPQIIGRFVIRRQFFNCMWLNVRTSAGEWWHCCDRRLMRARNARVGVCFKVFVQDCSTGTEADCALLLLLLPLLLLLLLLLLLVLPPPPPPYCYYYHHHQHTATTTTTTTTTILLLLPPPSTYYYYYYYYYYYCYYYY